MGKMPRVGRPRVPRSWERPAYGPGPGNGPCLPGDPALPAAASRTSISPSPPSYRLPSSTPPPVPHAPIGSPSAVLRGHRGGGESSSFRPVPAPRPCHRGGEKGLPAWRSGCRALTPVLRGSACSEEGFLVQEFHTWSKFLSRFGRNGCTLCPPLSALVRPGACWLRAFPEDPGISVCVRRTRPRLGLRGKISISTAVSATFFAPG